MILEACSAHPAITKTKKMMTTIILKENKLPNFQRILHKNILLMKKKVVMS